MISNSIVKSKLKRTFSLYEDLVSNLSGDELAKDLVGLPSNTIGQQIWCVIGARESYLNSILKGSWVGFSCSLEWNSTTDITAVLKSLTDSREKFLSAISELNALSENQQSLLLDLVEHETQHHGQLIRYLYALRIEIPSSWKKRYSLD